MNICKAVGLRISNLLLEKKMTLYRLEQKSSILHGTMMYIMNERNKNVTLKTIMQKTIMQLARGFDMTLLEFLDDKLFTEENIDLD